MAAKESRAMHERMKDSSAAVIFFLVLIILALVACLFSEHLAYTRLKQHDDTSSADNLNGQSPANTYTTPGTITGRPAPKPSTGNGATNTSAGQGGNTAPATGALPASNTAAPTTANPPASTNNTTPAATAAPPNGNTPTTEAPANQGSNQDNTGGNTQR